MCNVFKQSTGWASLTQIKGLILASLVFGVMALPSSVFAQSSNSVAAVIITTTSQTVVSYGLSNGTENSLLASLNAAISSVLNGNSNAACGQIGAFINKVSADETSGAITAQQAMDLLILAQAIKDALGCP